MEFLRNAILLCLTVFPRNYVLEEAALVAEELSVTKMNLSGCSVTPCQPLAKGLLKSDRQVFFLGINQFGGIYANQIQSGRGILFDNQTLSTGVLNPMWLIA